MSALLGRWSPISFTTTSLTAPGAASAGTWSVRMSVGRGNIMGDSRGPWTPWPLRWGSWGCCTPMIGRGRWATSSRRRRALGGGTRVGGRGVMAGRSWGAVVAWRWGRPAVIETQVNWVHFQKYCTKAQFRWAVPFSSTFIHSTQMLYTTTFNLFSYFADYMLHQSKQFEIICFWYQIKKIKTCSN